jgi:RNA polymerase sigma-70 factor (ECF subfamily)
VGLGPDLVPRDGDDDLAGLHAAREGDGDAATRLLRRHGPSMLATARRVLGKRAREEAEDAVQDALIAAWSTEALPVGDVGAWLRAVTVRKALDGRRRSRRLAEDPLPETDERAGAFRPPLETLALARAFERLSSADRAVLVLVDVEGLTMAEAARSLGATSMAVKWRAVRARRRLRAAIEGRNA